MLLFVLKLYAVLTITDFQIITYNVKSSDAIEFLTVFPFSILIYNYTKNCQYAIVTVRRM